MNRYYYHGIEFVYGCVGHVVELMIKILNEGLKNRKDVRNFKESEKYNHVCLFKKDDDNDYDSNNIESIMGSAYYGWIQQGFVFVINPDIEARKAIRGVETNLFDEWRSMGDISINDIVGIALPYGAINEYLSEPEMYKEDKELLEKSLIILKNKVSQLGIFIADSGVPNFTDELDSSLNKMNTIKR